MSLGLPRFLCNKRDNYQAIMILWLKTQASFKAVFLYVVINNQSRGWNIKLRKLTKKQLGQTWAVVAHYLLRLSPRKQQTCVVRIM